MPPRNWITMAAGTLGRSSFGMTFDPHRGRLVLFGGDGTSGPLGDTWELYSAQATPSEVFVAAIQNPSRLAYEIFSTLCFLVSRRHAHFIFSVKRIFLP